jgi:hypothetical protein
MKSGTQSEGGTALKRNPRIMLHVIAGLTFVKCSFFDRRLVLKFKGCRK